MIGLGMAPRPPGRAPPIRRLPAVSRPIDGASRLPPEAMRALRLVAAELRDMPHACIRDRAELVLWHARLARRLDALAALRMPVAVVPASAAVARPAGPPPRVAATGCAGAATSAAKRAPKPPRWRPRAGQASPAFRRLVEAAGQTRLPLSTS